jgi:hypothetical protein
MTEGTQPDFCSHENAAVRHDLKWVAQTAAPIEQQR